MQVPVIYFLDGRPLCQAQDINIIQQVLYWNISLKEQFRLDIGTYIIPNEKTNRYNIVDDWDDSLIKKLYSSLLSQNYIYLTYIRPNKNYFYTYFELTKIKLLFVNKNPSQLATNKIVEKKRLQIHQNSLTDPIFTIVLCQHHFLL